MKGRAVSVELTGLKEAVPDYEHFAHCWMDGDIVAHDEEKGTVMIRLRQRIGQLFKLPVDSERIQSVREHTLNHYWKKGDEVHVRETNGGKVGWWAATIVSNPAFGDTDCTVRWKGEYSEHGNTSDVKISDLRLATEPTNEEEDAPQEKDDKDDGAELKDAKEDGGGDKDKKQATVKRERASSPPKKKMSASSPKKKK